MAQRIEVVVTMKNIYTYRVPSYGYGMEDRYIYTMEGEDGTVYVWKTGTVFHGLKKSDKPHGYMIDEKGQVWDFIPIRKGDVVKIKASVKEQGEYKGQPQTVLQRVKLVDVISGGKTVEEIEAEKEAVMEAKKQEQADSIGENDLVWTMPYRQYKEHYSDCETVIDSYEERNGNKVIKVIIREGRLKNSGVRGRHFSGYEVEFTDNGKRVHCTFRAVSEENALKQWAREFKNGTDPEVVKVYRY